MSSMKCSYSSNVVFHQKFLGILFNNSWEIADIEFVWWCVGGWWWWWSKVIFMSNPTFELSWGWVGVVTKKTTKLGTAQLQLAKYYLTESHSFWERDPLPSLSNILKILRLGSALLSSPESCSPLFLISFRNSSKSTFPFPSLSTCLNNSRTWTWILFYSGQPKLNWTELALIS